ncbi:helix-turn-helix domain-containing protein [Rhodospirillum sp. A1_3_36]|uniref:helix-turn-helix domain-containing protein n=1 Tax=Rhodospirillum sp. A1_3_36 TaxID=3391666 RepID=UPI0039A62801
MENTRHSPKRGGGRGEAPTPVDITVGRRLRLRRRTLGLSIQDLAFDVGISDSQLRKYESGLNRISASRLYAFACALEVTPSYFFEDLPPPVPSPVPEGEAMLTDPLTWQMVTAFEGIRSPSHKRAAYALLISMAASSE